VWGNIAVDVREIQWRGVDWIGVAKGRDRCCDHGMKLLVA
jgi:hypothetical protein